MLIAINGELIKTENIWCIDEEVCYGDNILGHYMAHFTIYLFGREAIEIRIEDEEKLDQILKMHKEIVDLWSNNQGDIPRFKIK